MTEQRHKVKQRGKRQGDAKPRGESHTKLLNDNNASHSEMKGISLAQPSHIKSMTEVIDNSREFQTHFLQLCGTFPPCFKSFHIASSICVLVKRKGSSDLKK